MKRTVTMVVVMIVIALTISSCNPQGGIEALRKDYTPVLILNDSVHAINYKHVKNSSGEDMNILTISFTYNGEKKMAVTSDYSTAYTLDDSLKHDLAIGYFIKKKYIR